ncbi:NUDIX hydrolase [Bacteroidia bacterium]|nr:NUDIX hydrolase [Bacteroidia bacterium]
MDKEELFNVYLTSGERADIAATMEKITNNQLIFRIANVWIMNPRGQILLAKNNKRNHKNFSQWNASVTGRITANDTPLSGALREAKEELGLDLAPVDLRLLETQLYNKPATAAPVYVDIWLANVPDMDASEFVLQDSEVAAVEWHDLANVKNWRESGISIGSETFDRRLRPLLDWLGQ